MIICPRCEKEIHAQEPHTCQRKFSRRFFFGLMAGGVMAAAAKEILPPPIIVDTKLQAAWKLPYSYAAALTKEGWVVTEAEISDAGKLLEGIVGRSDLAEKFTRLASDVFIHADGGAVQIVQWGDE